MKKQIALLTLVGLVAICPSAYSQAPIPGGVTNVGLTYIVPDTPVWYNKNKLPDHVFAGYVTNGPIYNLNDQIPTTWSGDGGNHRNWEPYISVIGDHTFIVGLGIFADDGSWNNSTNHIGATGNQRYVMALQPAVGGQPKIGEVFYDDFGQPYSYHQTLRQLTPGPRVAGDKRYGATNFVSGGPAALMYCKHWFGIDYFNTDGRLNTAWPLYGTGFPSDCNNDCSGTPAGTTDSQWVFLQSFSLNPTTLVQTPLDKVQEPIYYPTWTNSVPPELVDQINGVPGTANTRVSYFGGDVVALSDGNYVVVVNDWTGFFGGSYGSGAAVAKIFRPDGSTVKAPWLVDPNEIWSNVAAYRGGFCVRVQTKFHFYDNAGTPQFTKTVSNPFLGIDTGNRGDATRIASDIRGRYVYLAGQGTIPQGNCVHLAIWDAQTGAFVTNAIVSSDLDPAAMVFSSTRVGLAVDALDRVCVAYDAVPDISRGYPNNEMIARVMNFDGTNVTYLTPSFFPFISSDNTNNLRAYGMKGFKSTNPNVAMTTKAICIAAKTTLNSTNNPAGGADSGAETDAYVVISHPAAVPLQPPDIVFQPASRTNAVGTTATFTVGATGSEPLNYQWWFNGTNLVNGGNLSGALTPSLTISNVQSSNAGSYFVVVTNAYGSTTSALANLTVYPFSYWPRSAREWYQLGYANDGIYTIDPDGPGGQAPISVYCLMSLSGGGWTKLTSTIANSVLNTDTSVAREYLYVKNNTTLWYRSPVSKLVWSWSSGQDLYGTYYYSSGGGEASFNVTPSSEHQLYGVGGSSGGYVTPKCLIYYWNYYDPANAQTYVCQDIPGIFGGACQGPVTVYIREKAATNEWPILTTVTANIPNPVPATTNFIIALRFDHSMKTNPVPTILLTNKAASIHATVSTNGYWTTTVLANDTYYTPRITFVTGMDGTNQLFVSGAQDLNGDTLALTNAAYFVVDATAPVMSNIMPTPGPVQCTVTWQTDEPAVFRIEYGISTNYTFTTTLSGQFVTSQSATLSTLAPSTLYHYRIHVFDLAGNETISGDFTFTTTPDTTPPVTSLASVPATLCSLPYTFSWTGTDNVTPPAGLMFAYQMDSEGWSAFGPATSLVVTQLTNGSHMFTVKAQDAAGNVDTNPPSASFTLNTAPPVISGVSASPSPDHCAITWHTDKPATSLVDYGITAAYGQSASSSQLVTNHTLTLLGLLAATPYHFRVTSQDGCGRQSSSGDVQFTTAPAPDLQVVSVSMPQEAWTGREFDVAWVVTNAGLTVATGPWVDRVYLSATNQLQTNQDQLLGEFPFSGHLDPTQSVQLIQTVTINRAGITNGPYYISVLTDAGNSVYEGFAETNNVGVSVSNINVHLTPLPDLAVASVDAPPSGMGGQAVDVSWIVCNQGGGATDEPFWYDHLYLSPTTNIANAIADYGEFLNPSYLAPGDCYEQIASVTLPVGVGGPYYFIVQADSTGWLTEGNTANNVGYTALPINIQLVQPGFLHVESVQVAPSSPTTVWAGGVVSVTWTVRNTGQSSITGTWDDEVTLSPTPVYDFINGYWDVIHHIYFTGPLAPGQAYTNSGQFTVPQGITAGNWYAVPIVDTHFFAGGNGSIGSGNIGRDQNSALVQVALPPPSDLEVTGVSAPTNAVAGQAISVGWTVANNGNNQTSSGYWYDALYLTTNSAFAPGLSRLIGTYGHWGVLDLTTNYSQSVSVIVPADLFATNIPVATNYLFVVSDAGNAVVELNKTNNVLGAAKPVVIQQAPPTLLADLAVTTVGAPWTIVAGGPATISWTVTNQGAGATSAGSWVDSVYLAPDPTLNPTLDQWLGDVPHNGTLASGGSYSQSQAFSLPYCAIGFYYVLVVADSGHQVNEGGALKNNVRPSDQAMHIWPGNAARLQVSAVNPPASVLAGAPLTVSWSVTNLANATTTAPWVDALYLSATPQFVPANAYLLGLYTNAANLASGGTYIHTQSPTVPRCFSGPYYVSVITDTGNVVNSISCNTNNWRTSGTPVQVTPSGYASLQVAGIGLPPAADSGVPWSVQWTVTNAGPSATSATWSDAIYASLSPVLDANALFLGQFDYTTGLASGASYTQTQAVAFPQCWSGAYYIYVIADVSNRVNWTACAVNNQARSSAPLTVNVGAYPDLVVSAVGIPDTAYAGQPMVVSWTVTNTGPATANGPWLDSVYLSASSVFSPGSSVFLGNYPSSNSLAAGAGYNQTAAFTLPNTTHGNFYVYVVTDSTNAVQECQGENNNATASSSILNVPVTLYPNLKVSTVQVPGSAYAGQAINISWTVTNQGTDATPGSTVWNDAVFLSKDQVLDPRDTRLGTVARPSSLGVGQSYTNTTTIQIPAGAAGPYYILVLADSAGSLFEYLGYNDSLGWNPSAMIVSLPPTADLAVTNVTLAPAAGVPGDAVTIGWNVRNVSSNSIPATWTDAAYLSTNTVWDINAVQVVRHDHSSLPASAAYSDSWAGPLPALTPGSYHAVVRTDVRNTVRETNLVNNTAVSANTIAVDVPVLVLGQPATNTLTTGSVRYYKLNVPAGETVRVTLAGASANSFNELFLRYGAVPDLGNYDFLYSTPFSPNQQIDIPTTQAGWYYIMVRGGNEPGGPLSYTLEADTVPFAIIRVSQNHIGDNGQVTITLSGAKFQPGATVQLVSGTNMYSAQTNFFFDATTVKARFLFTNAVHGIYDVVLANPDNQSTTALQAITNETALPLTAQVVPGLISTQPRVGLPFKWNGAVVNNGNVDIQYLTIAVSEDPPFPTTLIPPQDAVTLDTNFDLFVARDLAPSDSLGFSFVVSGFGYHRFYYDTMPKVQSKQEFLMEVADRAEELRQYILNTPDALSFTTTNTSGVIVTNNLSMTPDMLLLFTNAYNWENVFAHALVASGLLDTNDLSLLPQPQVTNSLRVTSNALTKDEAACENCPIAERAELKAAAKEWSQCMQGAILTCIGAITFPPLAPLCWLQLDECNKTWYSERDAAESKYNQCIKDNCPTQPPMCVLAQSQVGSSAVVYNDSAVAKAQSRGDSGGGAVCPKPPRDPNEMQGPTGYSDAAFVGSQVPWQYTIFFENTSNAVASARQITITNVLAPSFDVRTFRVSEVAFGNVSITVPANRSFYETRVAAPYPNPTNIVVDVAAGIDVQRGVVSLTLNAIDLNTGQLVERTDEGVLPPNTTNHIGEGHVIYTIKPKSAVPTGTVVTNQAAIVFDTNDPINTNPTTNTVDALPPSSSVAALPSSVLTTDFTVNWFGSDDAGGAGVQNYDIYVSDNGGPWQPWQTGISTNSATYGGQPGHCYYFYSVARDNSGNLGSTPPAYQAMTCVSTNQAPVLPPIADQTIFVGTGLTLTNVATDVNGSQNLTFSLQNAPAGASINPTNGYFTWDPSCAQGSTTNLITIWATDNGQPPLSNSVTFAVVVSECVQVSVGSTVMQIGTTSSVPVNLLSTVALTNLSFTLTYPSNRFNNWSATTTNPAIPGIAAQTLDPADAFFTLGTLSGQVLQGPSLVGSLAFSAPSNSSAFVLLSIGNIQGTKADGTPVGIRYAYGLGGRVVVIGNQPLLEASLGTNAQRVLRVYGNPGDAYQVNLSTNPATANWLYSWHFPQTNLAQDYYANQQLPAAFYRALKLSADPPLLELAGRSSNVVLLLYGRAGTNYVVRATTNVADPASWIPLANFTLTNSFRFLDAGRPTNQAQFYRIWRP